MKSEQIVAQPQNGQDSRIKDRPVICLTTHGQTRMLPAMPIEVKYDSEQAAVSLNQYGDEIEFRFDFPEKGEPGWKGNFIEAFSTRDTFLEIRTPGEALEFLRISGLFRGIDEDKRHERLSWANFQRWQGIVRILLREGVLPRREVRSTPKAVWVEYAIPENLRPALNDVSVVERGWLSGFPDQLVIRFRENQSPEKRRTLYAEIMVGSTLEAILATAYVDELRGVNYQVCALPDCPRIYEVRSKHQREFCSQACAHKASVRRRRAEQARPPAIKAKTTKTKVIKAKAAGKAKG
jgi:hypothetical protein